MKAAERAKEFANKKDIHLEDFDISYGKKELIINGDFTLEQGRRYGFVGRNGLGKSVLLRCLAGDHLHLPGHITKVHVEQEVEGDTRTVLQVVLQSHAARENLLHQERELTTRLEAGEEGVAAALASVYEELEGMESDSAPARAAIILTGLGFTPEMQEMETRVFSGGWRMRISLGQVHFVQKICKRKK